MPEDYGGNTDKLTDLVQRVLDSGGFSVTRELKDAPPTGYYVSYAGGDVIPVELFGPDSIREWQSKVGPDYIGAWLEDGDVYLDHTVRFDDKNEAMQFGVDNAQQAVYDANTGAVLPVVPPFTVPGQQLPFVSRLYHMPDLGPKVSNDRTVYRVVDAAETPEIERSYVFPGHFDQSNSSHHVQTLEEAEKYRQMMEGPWGTGQPHHIWEAKLLGPSTPDPDWEGGHMGPLAPVRRVASVHTSSAPNKFVTTKEQHLRSLEIHGPVKPHHHAN